MIEVYSTLVKVSLLGVDYILILYQVFWWFQWTSSSHIKICDDLCTNPLGRCSCSIMFNSSSLCRRPLRLRSCPRAVGWIDAITLLVTATAFVARPESQFTRRSIQMFDRPPVLSNLLLVSQVNMLRLGHSRLPIESRRLSWTWQIHANHSAVAQLQPIHGCCTCNTLESLHPIAFDASLPHNVKWQVHVRGILRVDAKCSSRIQWLHATWCAVPKKGSVYDYTTLSPWDSCATGHVACHFQLAPAWVVNSGSCPVLLWLITSSPLYHKPKAPSSQLKHRAWRIMESTVKTKRGFIYHPGRKDRTWMTWYHDIARMKLPVSAPFWVPCDLWLISTLFSTSSVSLRSAALVPGGGFISCSCSGGPTSWMRFQPLCSWIGSSQARHPCGWASKTERPFLNISYVFHPCVCSCVFWVNQFLLGSSRAPTKVLRPARKE